MIRLNKGTILVWKEKVDGYNCLPGAKAIVTDEDIILAGSYWKSSSHMVSIEFIDDLSRGQAKGKYFIHNFITVDEWREKRLDELGV
jgi:hypothetical protein